MSTFPENMFTRASFQKEKGAATEQQNMKMALFIRDNGFKVIGMEKASSWIKKQTMYSRVNGKIIKKMDLEQ